MKIHLFKKKVIDTAEIDDNVQPPTITDFKEMYKSGDHKSLARWAVWFMHLEDPFIKFIISSNLLTMGKRIKELPPFTIGADPEFILCDKDKLADSEIEIKMFSSKYTGTYFGVSEAEIGADYGLLEFRPAFTKTTGELVDQIVKLHTLFGNKFLDLVILNKEAIEFNHRRKRILDSMESEEDINFGSRGKDTGSWAMPAGSNTISVVDRNVWSAGEIILDYELPTTFSAYDESVFTQYNPTILSAGGHIHLGGTFVKMLSFDQIKSLVRELDEKILPMCKEVETEAAELRKLVYGSPGEFRIKDYGIEYRSPSNAIFWRKNKKVLGKVLLEVEQIVKNRHK